MRIKVNQYMRGIEGITKDKLFSNLHRVFAAWIKIRSFELTTLVRFVEMNIYFSITGLVTDGSHPFLTASFIDRCWHWKILHLLITFALF